MALPEETRLPSWLPPLLIAPFIGSFLGVLIRRLPVARPVVVSRSVCEACGRVLPPAELVPLISAALLRGRCRGCGAPIDPMHWRIELAALAVAAWAVLAAGGDGPADRLWADCGLGWTLLALAWIDQEHGRLPDVLTLPLVVAGLAATWLMEPWAILDHALGAAIGYAAFRLLALGYRAWRKRDGLGGGDAKLLAAAGAWVGLQSLGQVILLSALAALGAALLRRSRATPLGMATAVPFGPGLALGLWVVRVHGGWLP